MTPRDKLALLGWSCMAITSLIIIFSVTRSPYEIIEGIVKWVKTLRAKKKENPVEGRHHVVEGGDGPDVEDDSQVADHQGDDGTHQNGEKETA